MRHIKRYSPTHLTGHDNRKWPKELIICKRILEVAAEGHLMHYRPSWGAATHPAEPTVKYQCGALVAIYKRRDAAGVFGYVQLEAAYSHVMAEKDGENVKGVDFRCKARHHPLELHTTISFADLGDEAEVRKMVEFMGQRLLHATTNPDDFEQTGVAG